MHWYGSDSYKQKAVKQQNQAALHDILDECEKVLTQYDDAYKHTERHLEKAKRKCRFYEKMLQQYENPFSEDEIRIKQEVLEELTHAQTELRLVQNAFDKLLQEDTLANLSHWKTCQSDTKLALEKLEQ